jgi:DmsE family decaheme c-type cytochrome
MANRSFLSVSFGAFVLWFPATGGASPPKAQGAGVQERSDSVLTHSVPTDAVHGQREASKTTEDCRTCHEDNLLRFNGTYHASLDESCFSCHKGQAAEDHMKGQLEGTDVPGPSLAKLDRDEANAVCQSCHEKSHHAKWEGSAHQRRGLECISCHSVHDFKSEKFQLKTADAASTCYGCHQNIRAQMLRTSHHPVREGLMGCESCHDPHDGSTPKMIRADWTNELCLSCHQEKRGPFLWEHAPVRENCLNCHNPHGSNHDKMLVAKLPYLCQRCHLNTRHPGTFYDGVTAGTPIEASSNREIEHACKNCHQNIHGGNAPSGPYLGR